MIIVNFDRNELCKKAYGLWQYDYGQVLRIQGLNLPTAAEIHFALQETGGEAVTRIGVTKDGVTDVTIPDSLLEADGASQDYQIYVFIYLATPDSGETTRRITLGVKSRPRPEVFDTPGEEELFEGAVQAVNDAAKRAEEAGKEATAAAGEARESASQAGKHLADTQALAEQVEINADTVTQGTETARELLAQTQKAASNAVVSAEMAKQAETAAREAQTAAESAEDAARQYAADTEAGRQEVEKSKQSVEQMQNDVAKMQADVRADKEAVEQTVSEFGTAAQDALTALGQAQNTAVSAVTEEGQRQATTVQETGAQAVSEVDTAKTAAVGAVTAEGDKQVGRVQEAAAEIVADREQIQHNKADIATLTDKTNTLAPGIALGAKGGTIAVDDAAELPPQGLTVYGRSEQLVTTGTQLFDATDVERKAILNMDGTTSANGSVHTSGFVKVLPNETYSVSKTRQNRGKFYDIDKRVLTTDKFDFELSNSGDKFVTSEQTEYVRFSIYETENLDNVMVNAGDTLKPWEPYTGGKPSPSMEYPQEIVNAGDNGNIKVEVTGRNLFPLIEDNIVKNSPLTATINSDGSISIYGTPLKRYESVFTTQLIDFHPGTYYLGGGIFEKGKLIVQLNIVRNDDSVEYISNKSFELKKDDKKRNLSIQYSNAELIPVNQIIYPLLVYGAENVPFEPYKQPQTLTLKTPDGLPGIPVKSGGNYTDSTGQQWICDEIDLDREEKVQRIGRHIFNGTERFSYLYDEKYNLSRFSWLDYIEMAEIDTPVMHEKMQYVGTGETKENVIKGSRGFSRCYMYINAAVDTVEKFNKLIAGSEILYVLAEPIITPLTQKEIAAYKSLQLYSPNTTITNDAGCEMSLTYTVDTKKYVDKKIAAISAAMIGG